MSSESLVTASDQPLFSIVIPARNEEKYLPACLAAIEVAAQRWPGKVEVIVVVNRSEDRTEAIAEASGATVVRHDAKNLSSIRNAGARAARGVVIITIDADSRMSPNMLDRVYANLLTGKVIGGGVLIWPERWSLGILLTGVALLPIAFWHQVGGGLFFCLKSDFDTIGGFDEHYVTVEDIDFAKRLRAHGKLSKKNFIVLLAASITTSCRKFDHFGDWYFLKNPKLFLTILTGRNQEAGDKVWYDFKGR